MYFSILKPPYVGVPGGGSSRVCKEDGFFVLSAPGEDLLTIFLFFVCF